jgi:hypothetical protein
MVPSKASALRDRTERTTAGRPGMATSAPRMAGRPNAVRACPSCRLVRESCRLHCLRGSCDHGGGSEATAPDTHHTMPSVVPITDVDRVWADATRPCFSAQPQCCSGYGSHIRTRVHEVSPNAYIPMFFAYTVRGRAAADASVVTDEKEPPHDGHLRVLAGRAWNG